ncbi:MAG TPA: VOC family protein [Thermoanaerobaculia bacterium]|nr:VOC family protein [Thermoanaerobaculia bacterium]
MSTQSGPAGVAARWHHLHLTAPDPAAAADWYAEQLGGRRHDVGEYELALFDGHFFTWYGSQGYPPSQGSVIDHFGWSVPDLEKTMERLVAAGATALDGPRTVGDVQLKISFLEDPWGAKLELLEDAHLPGFHHVHVVTAGPAAERNWWLDRFGGEAARFKGLVDGIRHPRFWILFRESPGETAATVGRAIDHLGLQVDDVDAACRTLAERKDALECEPAAFGSNRFAFLSSPAGVRIELFQVGG